MIKIEDLKDEEKYVIDLGMDLDLLAQKTNRNELFVAKDPNVDFIHRKLSKRYAIVYQSSIGKFAPWIKLSKKDVLKAIDKLMARYSIEERTFIDMDHEDFKKIIAKHIFLANEYEFIDYDDED